jgi:hypothetical protein
VPRSNLDIGNNDIGVTAVKVLTYWKGVSAAAAAFAIIALAAQAQTPQPTTPTAKAPAAKTDTAKKDTAKKEPAKKVVCKGMNEAACGASATDCTWVAASKRKDGKEVAAYCRAKTAKEKLAAKKKSADTTKSSAPTKTTEPPKTTGPGTGSASKQPK